MAELFLVHPDRRGQTDLFEQLLEVWLGGKTPKTRAAYVKDIWAYAAHFHQSGHLISSNVDTRSEATPAPPTKSVTVQLDLQNEPS